MEKIRLGIVGYGNIGRGVAQAIRMNPDMELVAFFSRRDPALVELDPADAGTPVYAAKDAANYQDQIDVMLLCGGSATDLPQQGRNTPNCSTPWTALTPMQGFRSILRPWIKRPGRADT